MAPVMAMASVSNAGTKPFQQCCQMVPSVAAAACRLPASKSFARDGSLVSEDRRIMLQFSAQALQFTGKRKHASFVRPARAELAVNADSGNVIDVKEAEVMEKYLAEAGDRLVVVNISTKTCGPCKLIFPKFVTMSKEYPEVLFLRITGDSNNGTRALMRAWGVKAVPNFKFFLNGKMTHSHVGAKEDDLRAQFMIQYSAHVNVTV